MTEQGADGLVFAIADLHGRLDLLDAALAAIQAYPIDQAITPTIVFLGDYIDRGPHGAQVLDRLIAGPPIDWRWICLKGNHEAMMSLAMASPDRIDWWIGNGGDTTIASYRDDRARIASHLAWIESLPSFHVDRHRVFVHAGVDEHIPLNEQADKVLLWKRYTTKAATGYGERHVVHGHDPNRDGPLRLPGRTDLDTLAWATGRLVIGVFKDAPGGPIDLIEVRGPPA